MADRYLSVAQVAELLGTTERFPRRLIAERRIVFVKVGRHVRIPESALNAFIDVNTVQPIGDRRSSLRRAA
ncbi:MULTISPECIES: excisionase family DNA-binding protein [Streptomyces]|uniref:Excisionase family DNA binding protein n=1 Tax=Streptomyces griseoloalbus TaxID=67303 RepID=A0A7W8FA99_9ACTN|nr:excisionase family DNA-binding protein [Streptomyces albaduncus]MBB5127069.1 excisionase family DNA binding protein [Streptomyces albaduncus]GGW75775.1 DNA-binding protein [Streptomyces albaduncus]